MNLFINTTMLQATGIVQVAVSFINECKTIDAHTYTVLINERVEKQLDVSEFPPNFSFYRADIKPLHFAKNRKSIRLLKRLEKSLKPDCVFTVFGPSWWTPKAPHLMGYAHPQYVYEDSPYYTMISRLELWMKNIKKQIHRRALKKNGNYYVCETEDVCRRLTRFLDIDASATFSVSNTYNHYFEEYVEGKKILPEPLKNEFRFISLCAFYKHKNLEILNEVIPLLVKRLPHVEVRFVLTIGQAALDKYFSPEVRPYIYCLERVDVKDCPQLYHESNALFLPTLLECFTANYPEAMRMKKPIVTSDMTFAKEICGDAALYGEAVNANAYVDQMVNLIESPELQQKLIDKGMIRLKQFYTSSERASAYLALCEKISAGVKL